MSSPTIAFFGASGSAQSGTCASHALALALKAGYKCSALARTPSKVTDFLLANDVSESVINDKLVIVKGDAKDPSTVKEALAPSPKHEAVDTVVNGIGGTLEMGLYPKMPDPTICQDTAKCILDCLRELRPSSPPVYIGISSTGISRSGRRDVPLAFIPVYRWLLAQPHVDKRVMEEVVISAADQSSTMPIRGYVLVRPSFFTDGKRLGTESLRIGFEEEKGGDKTQLSPEERKSTVTGEPAIGYTVSRADVGGWIFDQLIQSTEKSKWFDKAVSVTY